MKQLIKTGDSLIHYYKNREDNMRALDKHIFVTREVRNEVLVSNLQGYVELNGIQTLITFEDVGGGIYLSKLRI